MSKKNIIIIAIIGLLSLGCSTTYGSRNELNKRDFSAYHISQIKKKKKKSRKHSKKKSSHRHRYSRKNASRNLSTNSASIINVPNENKTFYDKVISSGEQLLGKPYKYHRGLPWQMDCSGFVSYIYYLHGVRIPHNSAAIYNALPHVSRKDVRRGDIILFQGRNIRHKRVGHSGIVVSLDGNDIIFLHSSISGIKYQRLSKKYYSDRLVGFARVTEPKE